MKLYKIRGGSIEDLNSKKYNLGVGISLGNKWFTVPNIIELIKFCLLYTRKDVIVYVADSIHAINLEVRKRIKYEKALRLAEEMGNNLLEKVKKEVNKTFLPEDISKIHYIKWKEIADENFKKKVSYLYEFYRNNHNFKEYLNSIVKRKVADQSGLRVFTEDEIDRLSNYIIEELPQHIARVPMGKFNCDGFVYPYDGETVELAEKIQEGKLFPEVKDNIMDTEPEVFLEVR